MQSNSTSNALSNLKKVAYDVLPLDCLILHQSLKDGDIRRYIRKNDMDSLERRYKQLSSNFQSQILSQDDERKKLFLPNRNIPWSFRKSQTTVVK